MAELLFYKKALPLNREQHKEYKFVPVSDFSFTKSINSVPVSGVEFFEASRELPVLFSKDGNGTFFPLALLSLNNEGHQLVSDDGQWQGGYLPAFIRRYPFALAGEGTVCFDAESGLVGPDIENGKALFAEDGKDTEALANVMKFLNQFDHATKVTAEFTKQLAELDLFKPFKVQVKSSNEKPMRMDGLYIIDETKVAKLDDQLVLKWFKSGQLAWIYAHLHSLGALKRLAQK